MPSTPVDRLLAILERQQTTRIKRRSPRKPNDPDATKRERNPNQKSDREYVLETLQEARVLLEAGWVHHEIATDEDGNAVEADSPHAASWCISGALQAASYKVGFPATTAATRRIERSARAILHANGIQAQSNEHVIAAVARMNDDILDTQEAVLAAIDKAIAEVE